MKTKSMGPLDSTSLVTQEMARSSTPPPTGSDMENARAPSPVLSASASTPPGSPRKKVSQFIRNMISEFSPKKAAKESLPPETAKPPIAWPITKPVAPPRELRISTSRSSVRHESFSSINSAVSASSRRSVSSGSTTASRIPLKTMATGLRKSHKAFASDLHDLCRCKEGGAPNAELKELRVLVGYDEIEAAHNTLQQQIKEASDIFDVESDATVANDRLIKKLDLARTLMRTHRVSDPDKRILTNFHTMVEREIGFLTQALHPHEQIDQLPIHAAAVRAIPRDAFDITDKQVEQLAEMHQWLCATWDKVFEVEDGQLAHALLLKDMETLDFEGLAFHLTACKNLASIRSNGLDPDKGGANGGGSVAIGGDKDLQQHSHAQSKGVIAVAGDNETLAPYVHMRDAYANLVPGQPVENYGVIVRFSVKDASVKSDWQRDLKHRSAWQTTKSIQPEHIEVLRPGSGWIRLQRLDIAEFEHHIARPERDAPSDIRMAFTHSEFFEEFKGNHSIRDRANLSGTALLLQLKSLVAQKTMTTQGQELWTPLLQAKNGSQFAYIGATAHPVHNPKDWDAYVVSPVKGQNANKIAIYKKQTDAFQKKFVPAVGSGPSVASPVNARDARRGSGQSAKTRLRKNSDVSKS